MTTKSVQSRNTGRCRRTMFMLAVLVSTAWTPVALANEFPAVIPLSSLDGNNGFRLQSAASIKGGYSVTGAGDVNGDGFGDLIIGAPNASPHGLYLSGSSYVVFGKASGFGADVDLSSLDGTNGFRLDGMKQQEYSGASVAGIDDVNADGFDDVIVGTKYLSSSYVVFGKASGFTPRLKLSSLDGTNGFRLDGAAAAFAGRSVAGAGDVNGDGFADLIIGAPRAHFQGSSYVVFGKAASFGANIDLSSLDGTNGFRLDGTGYSGFSVAGAGDVNGDGFADVIIGAPYASPHGLLSGSSYVVFGKPSGFAATIDLSTLNGSNGFRLDGLGKSRQTGRSVAGAGDVNGDGFADVIVGMPTFPSDADRKSGGYVVFGKVSGFAATIDLFALDGSSGFHLEGAQSDYAGWSVAGAGDLNGDGFADVIVGAHTGGPGTGYVVFGKASGFPGDITLSSLDGTNGFRLYGVTGAIRTGWSVGGAGDVNGDGFGDVIIGALSPKGTSVVFGRAPDSVRTRVGTVANQYISGGPFGDVLKGRGGNDLLEGRKGADKLVGGSQNDTASYLHAAKRVKASLANPATNTGDGAGDSYTQVENITGSRFADTLIGDGLANRLTGDLGADELSGAGGNDRFIFNKVSDSPPGAGRDKITDFDAGDAATSVDNIDLRAIDAKPGPGNQAFKFIGQAAFSNTKGELRVEKAGSNAIIQGDVNGDGIAELAIELLNFTDLSALTAIDFRE